MQKTFLCKYESKDNLFKGEIVILAERISEAQDKFFSWLKKQQVYQHMWNLNMQITEINQEII